LRFRAILRTKEGHVREGWAQGVASVFTYQDRRGRGYAAKMMQLLAEKLRKMEEEQEGSAMFSVLFSDIGKEFYNKAGWAPFESTHLYLPSKPAPASTPASLQLIDMNNLPELVERDNQIVRSKLFASGEVSDKIRVAIVPDIDSYQRHFYREEFIGECLFKRKPNVHGAIYTVNDTSRVWAAWTRGFSGGPDKPEKNILYFLRLVVEDETISDEQLKEALTAILTTAQGQATEWACPNIQIWNPEARVRKLVEEVPELGAKFVVRESDSITSLQQFGGRRTSETEWVINEKFEWC
jgi:hypothetical protein